jgi:hypothetical protein
MILSPSLLVNPAVGFAFTVITIALLVPVQPPALVTMTSTVFPFASAEVVYVDSAPF